MSSSIKLSGESRPECLEITDADMEQIIKLTEQQLPLPLRVFGGYKCTECGEIMPIKPMIEHIKDRHGDYSQKYNVKQSNREDGASCNKKIKITPKS